MPNIISYLQVAVIKETRRLLGPDFHITYTIPATVAILEPWMSTISQTLEELDAVNVMAYDYYWQVRRQGQGARAICLLEFLKGRANVPIKS